MKITIRQAEAKDGPQFVDWATSTPNNLFDPDIVNYPSLLTLAVEKDEETISYVPFHPVIRRSITLLLAAALHILAYLTNKLASWERTETVLVIESLAHKPGITPRENAVGLIRAQDTIEEIAKKYGIAEVWWECADPRLIEFAARHGYRAVTTTVLRKKVGR